MGYGGCAEIVVPRDLVKDVVLYLQLVLRRQPGHALDQDPQLGRVIQLDDRNDWRLTH